MMQHEVGFKIGRDYPPPGVDRIVQRKAAQSSIKVKSKTSRSYTRLG
ncbi:MAG: hypothetical protein H0Z40_10470 [Desulfotomaculum sp.]|nr:hypothetical protein [Desulfotomaculum sp.]